MSVFSQFVRDYSAITALVKERKLHQAKAAAVALDPPASHTTEKTDLIQQIDEMIVLLDGTISDTLAAASNLDQAARIRSRKDNLDL